MDELQNVLWIAAALLVLGTYLLLWAFFLSTKLVLKVISVIGIVIGLIFIAGFMYQDWYEYIDTANNPPDGAIYSVFLEEDKTWKMHMRCSFVR